MAKAGKGSWALGLAVIALGAWWLLRQGAPDPGQALPVQAAQPTPLPTAAPLEPSPVPPSAKAPRLAIVIDDWGYQSAPIAALADLGFPITAAILPGLPFSARAAEAAYAAGDEVILHCPMQAKGKAKAEKGTLKAGMGEVQARELLARHYASIPHVVGLNNHEGSLASEDPALMAAVAGFLKERGGYFLDSVTTARSAIPKAAQAAGVPWAKRRIFLDNVDEPAAIRVELAKAAKLAVKQGSCIAIGHPRANTLAVLKEAGPGLAAQGIILVHVSELLAR